MKLSSNEAIAVMFGLGLLQGGHWLKGDIELALNLYASIGICLFVQAIEWVSLGCGRTGHGNPEGVFVVVDLHSGKSVVMACKSGM